MLGSATAGSATALAEDTIHAASPTSVLGRRRRSASPLPEDAARGRRKNPVKVSRACDFCKARKAKCNGMIPCDKCVVKGRICLYDTKYSRGRPPTPPPSVPQPGGLSTGGFRSETPGAASSVSRSASALGASASPRLPVAREIPTSLRRTAEREPLVTPSRASPELDMAEIQGQLFDPTSGVTFLHRAWKRLAHQHSAPVAPTDRTAHEQPWTLAGDKPLPQREGDRIALPPRYKARELLSLYFDVCIATYRFLHRGTTHSWLESVERSLEEGRPAWEEVGKPRAAIVLTVLAIASIHCERLCGGGPTSEPPGICADELFGMASCLTDTETGFPSLESAQARLIQVLYLLTTSRMNRAWYTFGNVVQIIAALGLHRRPNRKRGLASGGGDYIRAQCSIRTFWAAYILDQHLGVIFGRPRHYHDEDIDQEYPTSVDDEFMTAQGRIEKGDELDDGGSDCLIDALVFHAKIAQIIGQISKEVYSIKPTSDQDRVAAAHRLGTHLHDWRASLPPHLGSIRPSSLIPSLRRQATVLRLAYSHAIMHANRLFLLGSPSASHEPRVAECVGAARVVFETVDGLAREGPLFYSFWWTHYVTFCALLVTYVWETRQGGTGSVEGVEGGHERLLELANRCHRHLANATATNSPSRRYAVILEEFRREATGRVSRYGSPPQPSQEANSEQAPPRTHVPQSGPTVVNGWDAPSILPVNDADYATYDACVTGNGMTHIPPGSALLDEWQTTDWLDLDSSAFGPYLGIDVASVQWLSNGQFTSL